jgi:hypothetical protein
MRVEIGFRPVEVVSSERQGAEKAPKPKGARVNPNRHPPGRSGELSESEHGFR